jgi:hypothetical protein
MRAWTVLFAIALPALPQGFRFGVKGGVPLTHYFEAGSGGFPLRGFDEYSAATRRYTVGVTAERWIWPRLGIAADVLYKRMGYVAFHRSFGGGRGTESSYDVKGHSWDVPLMARYRPTGGAGPFLEGGPAFRYIGPLRARGEEFTFDLVAGTESRVRIDRGSTPELNNRLYAGVTAGGGFELRAGRVAVQPEVRYTHFVSNLDTALLRFRPHQVEVLLGLVF